MDILNDDAIKCIGQYTGILYGAESYVYFASTCNRMRNLLLPALETAEGGGEQHQAGGVTTNTIIDTVIRIRKLNYIRKHTPSHFTHPIFSPTNIYIHTLEQLVVFEKWIAGSGYIVAHEFRVDNRITFPFASTEIDSDMHECIEHITKLLRRYPNVRIRLDAHCGTPAPNSVAAEFSRERGMSVLNAIGGGDDNDNTTISEGGVTNSALDDDRNLNSRFHLVYWGKDIMNIVSELSQPMHPFYSDAYHGRGWVEFYFIVDGNNEGEEMVLPRRHGYYDDYNQLMRVYEMDTESESDILPMVML